MSHLSGPDGEDLSYPGFAEFARRNGLPGTEGSLRQLDTGWRDSPGAGILDAISAYFAIPIDFWTNDIVRAAVMQNDVDHRGHTLEMINRMLALPVQDLERLLEGGD